MAKRATGGRGRANETSGHGEDENLDRRTGGESEYAKSGDGGATSLMLRGGALLPDEKAR